MSKSLYEILGVSPDADSGDIKKAYRIKAQRLHPDKETGDEAAFKELLEAYDVLMDATRRKYYDENGEVPQQQQQSFIQEAIVVLLHIIDHIDSVKTTNVLAAAKNIVSGAIRKARDTRMGIEEQIEERKEAATRLTRKSGENILAQALLADVKAREVELARAKGLEEEGKLIHSFLSEHEYRVDAEAKSQGFGSMFISPSSTATWRPHGRF